MKKFLLLVLMASGGWLLADGGWIYLKAALAQELLDYSWHKTLETSQPAKPWPWADTWPLARLTVPRHGIDQIVLSGDSGRTLAFGPGHTQGSAMPGEAGSVVISGHRDTHFYFLKQLKSGHEILLQTTRGQYRYRVRDMRLLNIKHHKLVSDPDDAQLHLVTCFPFDSVVTGGPLRYVVDADLI